VSVQLPVMGSGPSFLGQGAFGQVFHDKKRNIAVKKIQNYHGDAKKEVEMMQKCQHKNIIQLKGFEYEGSTLCINMEFADKGTMKTLIEREPSTSIYFKEYNVWRTMCLLADALEYLHGMNILHRDIKPDNVLGVTVWVSRENRNGIMWKLADFGIAKLVTESCQDQFYNTASFRNRAIIAPEVWEDRSKFSVKADIWALGCLMVFVCNQGKDLQIPWIRDWRGLSTSDIKGSYSSDLFRVLQSMVAPSHHDRPSAWEIRRECTGDRQEVEIQH